MLFSVQRLFTYYFLCLLAAGCSGGKDSKDVQTGESELQGNWYQHCVKISDSSHTYVDSTLVVTGSNLTVAGTYFSDSQCQSKLYTSYYAGEIEQVGPATTPANANNLNLLLNTAEITVYDPMYISFYNGFVVCGHSDWTLNEKKSCPTYTGKTLYSLYAILDGVLVLGDGDSAHDGMTEAARPVELVAKEQGYVR